MREEHLEAAQTVKTPVSRKLLTHAHWGAMVLAIAIWALHLFGIVFPRHADLDAVEAGIPKRASLFRERVDGSFLDKREEQKRLIDLKNQVAASHGVLPGAPPAVASDLAYSKDILMLRREGAANEILFLPPRDLQVEVKMGSLVLTWLEDVDNNIEVDKWEILRAEGSEPFKTLATIRGDQTTYVDRTVTAGLTYRYRVLAITADESVAAEDRRSKPSAPQRAEAASDVRITLETADPAKKEAVLLVEKWHRGAWWPRKFTVRIGQAIGGKDAGTGIDYGTGRKLKSLTGKPVEETRQVEEVVFDGSGRVVLRGGSPVLEEVPVTERVLELTAVVEGGPLPHKTLRKRQKR